MLEIAMETVCACLCTTPRDNMFYLGNHSILQREGKQLLLCSVLQRLRTALVKNRLTSYKLNTMYQAQRDPYPSQFMPHFIWTK